MKYFLLFFSLLSLNGIAQDSSNISPQILTKVKIGQSITVENIRLKFVNVISDSRCPEDVTCVWPGEAEVFLELKKDGKTEEERIVVKATAPTVNGILVAESETKKLFLKALKPYPKTAGKIASGDYCLELIVLKKE
ncbi:MAG TPA: hypothetical protein VFM70_09930 [Salinimicrobium sp.]|nr:hypothetical protein [Salinimicrobium sp.]